MTPARIVCLLMALVAGAGGLALLHATGPTRPGRAPSSLAPRSVPRTGGPTPLALPDATPTARRFATAYIALLTSPGGRPLPDAAASVTRSAHEPLGAAPHQLAALRLNGLALHPTGPLELDAQATALTGSGQLPFAFHMTAVNNRWQITALTPPDPTSLTPPSPPAPAPPAAARSTAAHFALAYAAYAAHLTATGPRVGLTARHQLQAGEDPLANLPAGHQRPRLVHLELGPRQGATITATATLADADGITDSFSFLLNTTPSGWQPDAFLNTPGP